MKTKLNRAAFVFLICVFAVLATNAMSLYVYEELIPSRHCIHIFFAALWSTQFRAWIK